MVRGGDYAGAAQYGANLGYSPQQLTDYILFAAQDPNRISLPVNLTPSGLTQFIASQPAYQVGPVLPNVDTANTSTSNLGINPTDDSTAQKDLDRLIDSLGIRTVTANPNLTLLGDQTGGVNVTGNVTSPITGPKPDVDGSVTDFVGPV